MTLQGNDDHKIEESCFLLREKQEDAREKSTWTYVIDGGLALGVGGGFGGVYYVSQLTYTLQNMFQILVHKICGAAKLFDVP